MRDLLLLGCLVLAAATAGCQNAYADPGKGDSRPGYPPGASSAEPAGSAGVPPRDAEPSLDGGRPWAPSFDVAFAEAPPSAAPTPDEWTSAPIAKEARATDPACEVRRIREWYRVQCFRAHWNELVSGSRADVAFGCRRTQKDTEVCDETWIIFPARRGDRRAFEMFSWSKWGPSPDVILTEQFLEGDPFPWVSVHGFHWGF